MIRDMEEESSFCFMSNSELQKDVEYLCNPNALPKLNDHGKCICSEPYTGPDCQRCETGFKPELQVSKSTEDAED